MTYSPAMADAAAEVLLRYQSLGEIEVQWCEGDEVFAINRYGVVRQLQGSELVDHEMILQRATRDASD